MISNDIFDWECKLKAFQNYGKKYCSKYFEQDEIWINSNKKHGTEQ